MSMSTPSNDRNLLFGILALQMDFIGRDALIAGMNAWTLEKHRPLGEILVAQGALDPLDRASLDSLVDRHIAKHQDDPAQSLMSLHDSSVARKVLEVLADEDVMSEFSKLPSWLADSPTGQPGDEADPTIPITLGKSSSSGERFEIIRRHASGGLGQVSVARDTDLGRDVALKEIQDQFADHPGFRERFDLEVRINGNLEHPCIVPVYGKGTNAAGRPFYVMRFIKGDRLADRILKYHREAKTLSPAERSLQLRELLRHFLDVCEAIAYAHSRAVLHRDLKPGNIMLGPYGETMLIDWGLAKATDHRDPVVCDHDEDGGTFGHNIPQDPTRVGDMLGTARYMSPEAAQADPEKIGIRSDIYGLGATLYQILTDIPPIAKGTREEILDRVRRGEILKVRQVKPDVAKPLEAICHKALALRQEDRYQTAKELSADIKKWLADEEVSVMPDPWLTRAGRWARRHKTLVVTSIVLGFATIIGLSVDHYRVDREKQKTDRNFALARRAVRDIVLRITQKNLPGIPQAMELRRDVTNDAWNFTNELLAQRPTDPEILFDAAQVSREVGKVASLGGSLDRAKIAYDQAVRILSDLTRRFPANPHYLDILAHTLVDSAGVARMRGADSEAQESYQNAVRIVISRKNLPPTLDQPDPRITEGRLLAEFASFEIAQHHPTEAIRLGEESCTIFDELLRQSPSLLDILLAAEARQVRGEAYLESGDEARALASLNRCLQTCEKALKDGREWVSDRSYTFDSLVPNFQYIRSLARTNRARIFAGHANPADLVEAETEVALAIEELTKLASEFKEITMYPRAIARAREIQETLKKRHLGGISDDR